ncbi:hypothetical protein N7510_008846 [Penicillium lagena]|uniref:uncharacterized protein n=1 Tax=Penicillium lagena TaxID=94218 RepID=UPI002540CCF7|nr:uncharacterized protein N7510_008846 [Penicillium lagena]KAJ5606065.1 hypothetical protein N7510_008846 [Penicillium lagena]
MSWNRIPPEIFDDINQYLDLETIKNFRLASKHTAERCLGPRFLSFVPSHAETDLTETSLQNLAARALHPVFRKTVQRLTIKAVFYAHHGDYITSKRWRPSLARWNVSDRLLEMIWGNREPWEPQNVKWLKSQQKARDALSDEFVIKTLATALDQFLVLDIIKLQPWIAVTPEKEKKIDFWYPVGFQWASHVSLLTLAAVARSTSAVRQLDIYGRLEPDGGGPPPNCCTIPAVDIATYLAQMHRDGLKGNSLPMERFGVHLSGLSWKSYSGKQGYMQKFFKKSLSVFPGGSRQNPGLLLQSMTNILDLYLYFDYDYDYYPCSVPRSYYQIFASITNNVHLHQLKHCHLSYFPVTVTVLCDFLKRHQHLVSLSMKGLCLPDGKTWDPILEFIGTYFRDLESLKLQFLYQAGRRVELNPNPTNDLDWHEGHQIFVHSCQLESSTCAKYHRAHKYFGHLGRGRYAGSYFYLSFYLIEWKLRPETSAHAVPWQKGIFS